MPDNPLVNFLRSYGPSAEADSLCDEHVQAAVKRYGVRPVEIPAPRLDEIANALLGAEPTNVVLTGTAGDGKTYHIRKFWQDVLKGDPALWPGDGGVLEARLPDGRSLRIVKDLSEVGDSLKAGEIERVTRCLIGDDASTLYLLAANDGQLLKFWRDAMEGREPGRERDAFAKVHASLADMLHHDLSADRDGSLAIRLMNLSRSAATDTFDTVVDAILGHEQWADCGECPAASCVDGRCPILVNRELLAVKPDGAFGGNFRSRLKDAIRVAAANDQHVPIRQLLTLTVNIILGDKASVNGPPLLTCVKARARARERAYRHTNPFQNVLGFNLRPSYRERYAVFSILDVFGIGHETNNAIDGLLVDGKPAAVRDGVFDRDLEHGESHFSRSRDLYLRGASGLDPVEFGRMVQAQRRRLFFTLPGTHGGDPLSPWRLTVFHHAGRYLDFCDALAKGGPEDDVAMRQIVKGLNRTLTGMMADDTDQLWLAMSVGKGDGSSGRLATVPPVPRRGMGPFRVAVRFSENTRRPSLRVEPARGGGEGGASLDLTPLLFEYLMRVAEGSLPSSFSRQCQREIRHFAMNAADAVARFYQPDDEPVTEVAILSVGGDGRIGSRQIEVGA